MPMMRSYEIVRTQRVVIHSTDIYEAQRVAEAFLDDKSISAEFGRVSTESVKKSISAKEL